MDLTGPVAMYSTSVTSLGVDNLIVGGGGGGGGMRVGERNFKK